MFTQQGGDLGPVVNLNGRRRAQLQEHYSLGWLQGKAAQDERGQIVVRLEVRLNLLTQRGEVARTFDLDPPTSPLALLEDSVKTSVRHTVPKIDYTNAVSWRDVS